MVKTAYRARRRVEGWQPPQRRVDGGRGASAHCARHPRTRDARRGAHRSTCAVPAWERELPQPRTARPPAPVLAPYAARHVEHPRWQEALVACLGALGLLVIAGAIL
jgi:hypothetical protein